MFRMIENKNIALDYKAQWFVLFKRHLYKIYSKYFQPYGNVQYALLYLSYFINHATSEMGGRGGEKTFKEDALYLPLIL